LLTTPVKARALNDIADQACTRAMLRHAAHFTAFDDLKRQPTLWACAALKLAFDIGVRYTKSYDNVRDNRAHGAPPRPAPDPDALDGRRLPDDADLDNNADVAQLPAAADPDNADQHADPSGDQPALVLEAPAC
jgi:hypothetical protein